MKNFIILVNVAIILWITSIFSVEHSTDDTSLNTKKANVVEAENHLVAGLEREGKIAYQNSRLPKINANSSFDDYVSEFIYEMSDARIMDIEQGKIAQQRGTSRMLKDYGKLMVDDQNRMLEELQKLAAEKGLKVTTSLSENKSSGLKDLKEKHGKDFDDKFVRMMTIDHKRDVKKLEKALLSTDADIQVFATKYLPLVKTHLDKIRSIK